MGIGRLVGKRLIVPRQTKAAHSGRLIVRVPRFGDIPLRYAPYEDSPASRRRGGPFLGSSSGTNLNPVDSFQAASGAKPASCRFALPRCVRSSPLRGSGTPAIRAAAVTFLAFGCGT